MSALAKKAKAPTLTTGWLIMAPREFFNLDEIFQDDDQGLLDTRDSNQAPGQIYRLREGFAEINGFVDEHEKAPSDEGDQLERRLARRLAAIRRDRRPMHPRLLRLHFQNYCLKRRVQGG